MSNAKGYTLIEILVGLSIIGLLFGFGYSSFRDFSRRQALSGTAKKIQGNIRLAQQEALSGRKPNNAFCNSPNTLTGFGLDIYSTSAYRIIAICSGGNVTIRDIPLPTGISIGIPSPNPIIFKVVGQGTNITQGSSVSISITQTATGELNQISISSSGDVN